MPNRSKRIDIILPLRRILTPILRLGRMNCPKHMEGDLTCLCECFELSVRYMAMSERLTVSSDFLCILPGWVPVLYIYIPVTALLSLPVRLPSTTSLS